MTPLKLAAVLAATAALLFPATTSGAGAGYAFDGGTTAERRTVAAALAASSFDWSVVPGPVTIHIVRDQPSRALPHEIWLDAGVLQAGRFAWGLVQHEYAHQVDFLVFDDDERRELLSRLGGRDWCYSVPGLSHAQYGCERFASTLAWAFWPSPDNCMRPTGRRDESASMRPRTFRALVVRLTRERV
jgi:hypothetical protein